MARCEQSPGQSVLAHGESVHAYYADLIKHLSSGTPTQFTWKLPEWLVEHRDALLARQVPFDVARRYQVMHDCGKPYCLTVEDGRRHFSNHAEVSAKVWRDAGGDEQIARLIERDMNIHTIKDDGVGAFTALPEAATLLLTGLCEVHSNAAMFGGTDSTSFKIKWKQIDRRGRAICKVLFGG